VCRAARARRARCTTAPVCCAAWSTRKRGGARDDGGRRRRRCSRRLDGLGAVADGRHDHAMRPAVRQRRGIAAVSTNFLSFGISATVSEASGNGRSKPDSSLETIRGVSGGNWNQQLHDAQVPAAGRPSPAGLSTLGFQKPRWRARIAASALGPRAGGRRRDAGRPAPWFLGAGVDTARAYPKEDLLRARAQRSRRSRPESRCGSRSPAPSRGATRRRGGGPKRRHSMTSRGRGSRACGATRTRQMLSAALGAALVARRRCRPLRLLLRASGGRPTPRVPVLSLLHPR
jgi:hypothetical protein